jgi:hypothetical protein
MLDLRIDLNLRTASTGTTITKYTTNEQAIFGLVGQDGSVRFDGLSMADDEWTVTATLDFDTAAGEPPVASIDLGPRYVLPAGATGLPLSSIRNASFDPDGDLTYDSWTVDDDQVGPSHVLGVGLHTLRLEVRDSRYAFDYVEQTVEIKRADQ